MTGTVKTVLIVGGVVVVAVIAMKMISQSSPVPKNTAPGNMTSAFISGIVSGVGGWFSRGPSSQPANAPLANISVTGPGDAYYNSSVTDAYRAEGTDSQGALNGPFL